MASLLCLALALAPAVAPVDPVAPAEPVMTPAPAPSQAAAPAPSQAAAPGPAGTPARAPEVTPTSGPTSAGTSTGTSTDAAPERWITRLRPRRHMVELGPLIGTWRPPANHNLISAAELVDRNWVMPRIRPALDLGLQFDYLAVRYLALGLRGSLAHTHTAEGGAARMYRVVAAVSGQHVAAVSSQGRRLLEDVLSPADAWRRGRPDLLAAAVSPAVVGEAMRVFRQLPAFGLDAERCELIRNLLLGSLRERIDRGADGPECFAALVYGGSDLLDELERYSCERHLRRWQPVSLAPDFVTVQQLAWGMEPGRSGYTRLQWQLRPLAALPRPQSMQAQAALTVCLAASYAAPRGEFLQEVARATLGLGD